MTSGCDDKVTAAGRRIPDWFIFAHKEDCDGGSDAAERARVCADVDVVPCSRVSETGLRSVSWAGRGHASFALTLPTACDMVKVLLSAHGFDLFCRGRITMKIWANAYVRANVDNSRCDSLLMYNDTASHLEMLRIEFELK